MSGSKLSNPAENKKMVDVPLAMTVHDMPAPGDVAQADERRTLSGRLKMLLVMLVCAAPVIASYVTYYVIRPEGRRNYGELITPPKEMPQVTVRDVQGMALPLTRLKGQWLLVSVGGGRMRRGLPAEPVFSASAARGTWQGQRPSGQTLVDHR